jgi:S1-C subfamily serine protease
MIDPLLLSSVKVLTFNAGQPLTNASGFFFQRGENLFLVTSLHVVRDESSQHFPDLVRIALHTDRDNIAQLMDFEVPLYRDGQSVWRQGNDAAGDIDVAVIALERAALPADLVYYSFTADHLPAAGEVPVGTSLLIVGFPLGFQDTLHQLPVARHAIVSSCFDLRFQGEGYFLTDARTHRGMSGAPVVMKMNSPPDRECPLPWLLLGIHSARLDVGTRDATIDEGLGLNCTWFADILLALTEDA